MTENEVLSNEVPADLANCKLGYDCFTGWFRAINVLFSSENSPKRSPWCCIRLGHRLFGEDNPFHFYLPTRRVENVREHESASGSGLSEGLVSK